VPQHHHAGARASNHYQLARAFPGLRPADFRGVFTMDSGSEAGMTGNNGYLPVYLLMPVNSWVLASQTCQEAVFPALF